MRNSLYFYYLTLNLFKDKKKLISTILISSIIIFLLSSIFFIQDSIKASLKSTIKNQPDFIIQKNRGGRQVDLPLDWIDKISQIYGVTSITPRVYGRYYFEDKKKWALIIGVDFLEDISNKELEKIFKDINLKEFIKGSNMIVGSEVYSYLKSHFYNKDYNFLSPNGEFIKVKIYKVLPKELALNYGNVIITSLDLAKKILGVDEDKISDIAINVANKDEWANIEDKLNALFYDILVVSKDDIKRAYDNIFNFKGGIFLSLFLITLTTFMLILYQRYSLVNLDEKKEIAILRSLGWSVKDILKFKLFESLISAIFAFLIGVLSAYIFVFIFNAPILKDIFLGDSNLKNSVIFIRVVDFSTIATIFILFIIPFIASILIPVWKIAISSPKEALK
ncbi:MAG: FtsX-like permease family protein [Epsilonproteobacteria bacterium]|nr:FtsX-like permease family protein [Campylobacterota bacterium]